MKNFNEWLEQRDQELHNEIFGGIAKNIANSKTGRAIITSAGLLGGLAGGAHAAESHQQTQHQQTEKSTFRHPDVIEKDGYVYIKGTAKVSGESPRDKLNAAEVAETKLMATASKYFASKGEKGGFVPGGYKEIVKKSDFLTGKSDRIVYAWRISN